MALTKAEMAERLFDEVVVHRDFQGDLPQQVRLILRPAIRLVLPALPCEPHRIGDGQPRHADPP